ncbi:MAG: type II toxin-antitoxin system prevent-host-death family antitoxin [Chloroflexi bacterium]|nr:type II toxin-antitoxin system prevent-host-death family antitoxin [Chloroflexota bacterium]
MKTFTVEEAQTNLAQLLKSAEQGETVYIEGHDSNIFELVLIALASEGAPKAGIMRGKVKIAPDFNDPLPEFQASTK